MNGFGSICVTGGAGYIGSHACLELSRKGVTPLVIDNLSTGNRNAVRYGPLAEVDLRDTAAVTEALLRHSVETVLHFAASAYVGESVEKPDLYYDNNVVGMMSLLNACADAGVRTFILSSSCATYGIPDQVPVPVHTPQEPINPYGMTKLICERMLKDIGPQHGMRYGILRYFNVAGADASGTLRETHDPETHLIPLTLMAARGQTEGLQIFGTDYDTPDGSCIRDYVHVSDLVDGHIQALNHLRKSGDNLVVNLGSGRGTSNLEIVKTVEAVTGLRVPVEFGPRRPGDPPALVADLTRARDLLGFDPVRSELTKIIEDAARSFGMEEPDAVAV